VSHSRAATALLLVLIAACTAAFLRTEQLKLRKSPLARPHVRQAISPGCQRPCHPRAEISFRLRSPQRLALAVVDAEGNVVRQLEPETLHPKGDLNVIWDGRNDDGVVVADGRYRLRVTLGSDRRDVTIPDPIVVDTRPAGITIGHITRRPGSITIPFTRGAANVRAVITVLQGSRVVLEKTAVLNPAHLKLSRLPPGRYRIEMVAVDAAGNRTPDPPSFRVTVP
jgi:hypothetical protein